MIKIRATHHYAFRSGEWADLFSIQYDDEGRALYVVEFEDGAQDVWPAWDLQHGYEVRVEY